MSEPIAALILAGGLSSRMGKDKAILEIDEKPLIGWAVGTIAKITDHIYVSVHDNQTAHHFQSLLRHEVTYIIDRYDGPRSVMLALLSSFSVIKERHVIVFPVDSPFLSTHLISAMTPKAPYFDLVIPMWPNGKIEVIHGIYDKETIFPIVETLWSEGTLDLQSLVRHTRTTLFLGTEQLAEADPMLLSLMDADTPEEFESLKSVRSRRSQVSRP